MKKNLVFIIILLIQTIGIAQDVNYYLANGKGLLNLNRESDALKIFQKGIEKYPNNESLYFYAGKTALNLNNYILAKSYFDKVNDSTLRQSIIDLDTKHGLNYKAQKQSRENTRIQEKKKIRSILHQELKIYKNLEDEVLFLLKKRNNKAGSSNNLEQEEIASLLDSLSKKLYYISTSIKYVKRKNYQPETTHTEYYISGGEIVEEKYTSGGNYTQISNYEVEIEIHNTSNLNLSLNLYSSYDQKVFIGLGGKRYKYNSPSLYEEFTSDHQNINLKPYSKKRVLLKGNCNKYMTINGGGYLVKIGSFTLN